MQIHRTDYTAKGYRLAYFEVDGGGAYVVSVETPWLDLEKRTQSSIIVARVVLLTATQHGLNVGFLRHAVSFFGDDFLVAQVDDLLRAILQSLPEGGDPPAQADPNAN